MRAAMAALYVLLVFCEAGAGAEATPLTIDVKKHEQRFREREEWYRRTLADAFDKLGNHDERWDKPAREAAGAAACFYCASTAQPASLHDVHLSAKVAFNAQCRDPLLMYLYAASSKRPDFCGHRELSQRYLSAAKVMKSSKYDPVWQATALIEAASSKHLHRFDNHPENPSEFLADIVKLAVAEAGSTSWHQAADDEWFDVLDRSVELEDLLGVKAGGCVASLDGVAKASPYWKAMARQLVASTILRRARKERDDAPKSPVNEKAEAAFRDRLAEARIALLRAWEIQPAHGRTAWLMLTVEREAKAKRADLEMWFERVIAAHDSHTRRACQEKLYWLAHDSHGSAKEMLEFARACRETKAWLIGLPLVAADAHWRLAGVRDPVLTIPTYFQSTDVRNEIIDIYTEYFKLFPADVHEHARFGILAYYCGRPEIVEPQFEKALTVMVPIAPLTETNIHELRHTAYLQAVDLKNKAKPVKK